LSSGVLSVLLPSSAIGQHTTLRQLRKAMMLLDGGLGHLLKEKGLRIPGLPYDQQFLAGVLVSTLADCNCTSSCRKRYPTLTA
jgi:hypothetical protein